MVLVQNKAIRTVLGWQIIATAAMTLVLGLLTSVHGAVSAMLGGLVGICAGISFSIVISLSKSDSLAGTLITAFRAEAAKVFVAVVLLWVVLATYKDVVAVGFIGSFAISILIFGMAFFVREP
jgi:ATP synthase protein I